MSQLQERILQFRKMATDDPDNELGHFRLGQLLFEAGDFAEASQSFKRTLDLSPQFSKVYHLQAVTLLKLNRQEDAIAVLEKGYAIAEERGDNIPRDEMAALLKSLGRPVPERKPDVDQGPGGGFRCQRPGCMAGKHAHQLPKPPMNDELGQRIQKEVCADCWSDWLKNYSIKVINELRLDLSTERGQEEYDRYMREYLGLD
jgi:Fe-S cluster biosynthesis and repair protein YggX